MRNAKLFLAAFAAVVGFTAPAAAAFSDPVTPVSLQSYDFTTSMEQTQLTGSIINTGSPGPYIGAFYLNLDVASGLLAFCDDLTNDIVPDEVPYDYFATTTRQGVDDYLSPLSQNDINSIIGLVFSATIAPPFLSPQDGAAYQLAIWDLEYGAANITANAGGDPGLQAAADALRANALSFYADFLADGTFDVVQLESPCDPDLAGTITFQSSPFKDDPNCQVQGLILVVPKPPNTNLPEPGTLALLGSGLVGLGMYRRRRRKA